MYNIAVDAGRSEIRAFDGENWVRFSNIIAPDVGTKWGASPDNTYDVEIKGKKLIIGEGATNSMLPRSVMTSSKLDDDTIAMILTAIYALVKKQNISTNLPISLALGIPAYRHERDKDALVEKLQKTHDITVNGDQKYITIRDIAVIPEGVGVYLNELLDDNGKVRRLEIVEGDIGIIDIGQRTTDWLVISNGEMNDEYSNGCDTGMHKLYETMRRMIIKHHNVDIEINYLDDVIRNKHGILKIGRGDIDIREYWKIMKQNLADTIIAGSQATWNDKLSNIQHIILAGGGGKLLLDNFQTIFKQQNINVTLAQHPRDANILGFYKLIDAN